MSSGKWRAICLDLNVLKDFVMETRSHSFHIVNISWWLCETNPEQKFQF